MNASSSTHMPSVNLLLLIRHGEAVPKDVGLDDFERALTPDGASGCDQTAEALAQHGIRMDIMISSPADRALETAHTFARRLGYPTRRVRISFPLYESRTIRPLVGEIRALERTARTVALVGHCPILDELAAYFVPGFKAAISKGGMVGISFDSETWTETGRGAGRLVFNIAPPLRRSVKAQGKRRQS